MTAPCTCIAELQRQLDAHNTRLVLTAKPGSIVRFPPTLATAPIRRGGPAPLAVVATHCPFCGAPYWPEPEDDE